jgi:hypothetical protein
MKFRTTPSPPQARAGRLKNLYTNERQTRASPTWQTQCRVIGNTKSWPRGSFSLLPSQITPALPQMLCHIRGKRDKRSPCLCVNTSRTADYRSVRQHLTNCRLPCLYVNASRTADYRSVRQHPTNCRLPWLYVNTSPTADYRACTSIPHQMQITVPVRQHLTNCRCTEIHLPMLWMGLS